MDYNERDCDVLIPLENLGLSNRSFNCLRRSGILNFHDFMQINSSQLELIHNLGEKSIAEITVYRANEFRMNVSTGEELKCSTCAQNTSLERKAFYW